ncbi:MAG: killer suppression protein [Acidimicrobiales bacterium]|nr:killer suppression protein [Acidimicrobiales bacterium]MXX43324.1 killer suppression protein [Acidimicrobiales bacterium]MXY02141.1 killer suppression protein [Acidimicrobiales bacterium]MXZ16309.1 killer suppression protein [Acidimicrobiales bacterium]MYA25445.1 killer suppression protein [Acidimicrobiales bacterium]
MEVLFATRKLQRRLNSMAELRKAYGDPMARKIALRLQQMSAARHLGDLRNLPGRWHELTGDLQDCLACDLAGPYRLIFRPTEESPPRSAGGGLDWSAVDSVTVTDIDDYH